MSYLNKNNEFSDNKQEVFSITYEEIGFFPRSFSRVLDRFLKQVFSDVENLVIQEYRFYRYLFLTTLKCLLILFLVPFFVHFLTKTYIVKPLTEYFWNTKQTEIFLNSYQQKRAFSELKEFEEKTYFESLIFPKSAFTPSLNFIQQNNYSSVPVLEESASMSFSKASHSLGGEQGAGRALEPQVEDKKKELEEKNLSFIGNDSTLSFFSSTSLTEREKQGAISTEKSPFILGEGPFLAPAVPLLDFTLPNLTLSVSSKGTVGAFALHHRCSCPTKLDPTPMVPLLDTESVKLGKVGQEHLRCQAKAPTVPLLDIEDVKLSKSIVDVKQREVRVSHLVALFSEGEKRLPSKGTSAVTLDSSTEGSEIKCNRKEKPALADAKAMLVQDKKETQSPLENAGFLLFPAEQQGIKNKIEASFSQNESMVEKTQLNKEEKGLYEKSSLFVYQTLEADKNIQKRYQEKTIELAQRYNDQSIEAITNFFADLISLLTLIYLLYALEIQINITKSFLLEVFFGLDDSKKSLLILLITDLLVGYHSSNLWELFFEFLFHHYGLPESQTGIFLLVATLPVLLDVLFKYLIFRHLNRSSPATVATYHAMIE